MLSICADKENPAGKFSCGSLKSLNHNNLDEILIDFWKNHYSASRMTLAIQSILPTNKIIEWIDNLFNEIPTNNQPPHEFKICQEPFCPDLFHRIFRIESVSCIEKITFFWYLPPVIKLYKTKPLDYISWIIGHEGEGTLINYLRKLNYALNLESGEFSDICNTSIYSIFFINIELTDLGFKNLEKIIELTFSYLNLVKEKGISEHIFEQIKVQAENDFNFSGDKVGLDNAIMLSKNMFLYEEEDYLSGPTLFYEYSPEIISKFLNLLTVDRVAIFIQAKQFDNSDLFIEEPIYNVKYLAENFKDDLVYKWSTINTHPFFKIPNENKYLSTDFSILPVTTDIKYPEKIIENDYIELWFKQDNYFKLPIINAMFYFITQIPSKSLNDFVIFDLFFETLIFILKEEAYSAYIGKLKVVFKLTNEGFELKFDGFNEKLPLFIEVVINHIKNYNNLITEDIFTMVKSNVINKYKTDRYDPDYIVSDIKQSVIIVPQWDLEKRLKCAENINYNQVVKMSEQLNNLYCRALIQGNINTTQAIEITNKVISILNYQPLTKECFPVMKINILKQGDWRLTVINNNPKDNNSLCYKYYQFDKIELSDVVKLEVLESMIEDCAYDELRTKQCLGYDIEISIVEQYDYYGVHFKVAHQIDKFKTEDVFSRMDKFIEQFWNHIINPDDIDKVIQSLIKVKEAPDDCLADEFKRNKREIISGRYKFNRLELQLEALKNIKFEDIEHLKYGFINGRVFSIEIVGNHPTVDVINEEHINKKKKANFTHIKDLDEFKNSLNMY